VALIVAFAVAIVAAPVAARVARRLGIVDRPGPLKVQAKPVPYLGGVAVLAGLTVPIAVERPVLFVPLALALGLGLSDDVAETPAAARLSLEVAIGVIAAWVLPARDLSGALITVALVVGLINAVNLLDGLDGLASAVSLVSAVGFAVVLEGEYQVIALALAGSLAGFLVWNRPPARIYLGDGGSYLVGTVLAILLAASFKNGESIALASGSLLFVAVPVADTTVAIVRRARAGRRLLSGDRGHVYDQLVDRGRGPLATVGACALAQAVFVGIGIGITSLPACLAVAAALALVFLAGAVVLVAFTAPGTWEAR
jgi:UDP-GlcNAc:undecaprenyl-phosphate/decaprenyl-phosphate GlcNAc-1-phosphate transferase